MFRRQSKKLVKGSNCFTTRSRIDPHCIFLGRPTTFVGMKREVGAMEQDNVQLFGSELVRE